jgi:hypothetical protein
MVYFDIIVSDQVYTAQDLQSARLIHTRDEMIETIIDIIPSYQTEEYPLSKVIQEMIDPQLKLETIDSLRDYLNSLSEEEIKTYYAWVRCYNQRSQYDELYREIDPTNYYLIDEIVYARKLRHLFRELFEAGFDCLGAGTGRRVFEFNDFVLKVPYTDMGSVESSKEIEAAEQYPFFARVKPIQYVTQDGDLFYLTVMQKVYLPVAPEDKLRLRQQIRREYPQFTYWSWGYDIDGYPTVYDFD